MSLFGRRAVVQVDEGSTALTIEGLDVSFKIELDSRQFGKAQIDVFNLNEEHRRKLSDSKTVDVALSVGYVGQPLERLCKGTLRDVLSKYDPPDWITTLRTGDGDKASKLRTNRSYGAGTPMDKVWKDLVDKLKDSLDVGNAIEAFQNGQFTNGITELLHGGATHGLAIDELRKIGTSAGLDVSVQEGELIITQAGQPLETTAIVLSPDTGLIGSPQPAPNKRLKCRALILPGLKPKRKIEIKRASVTGLYVIEKAIYTGSTFANDWYADLECREF